MTRQLVPAPRWLLITLAVLVGGLGVTGLWVACTATPEGPTLVAWLMVNVALVSMGTAGFRQGFSPSYLEPRSHRCARCTPSDAPSTAGVSHDEKPGPGQGRWPASDSEPSEQIAPNRREAR